MTRVVTLGAAYSANKGAASMLQSLVDNLPKRLGPCSITAVSTHPGDDPAALARAGAPVRVVSQRPVELALVHLPLALLAGALRTAGLPWRWLCRPGALRAMADADVVADISGISFVDGRRPAVLVYNALVVAVPLLLGAPVVKCAQAMGPFRTTVNRLMAKPVLGRLRAICPRGSATEANLRDFGLTNLHPAGDLAFTMAVPDEVRERAETMLSERAGPGPYLVVSPSQVVDTSCAAADIDYRGILSSFMDTMAATDGSTVVLLAHSAQPGSEVGHMNDLPLCRTLHQGLARRDRVVFLDEDLLPTELRSIIGAAEVVVTSRFHAMISSLAEATPPLVVGWSHKYAEILDPFELGDLAITYDDLTSGDDLAARTGDLLARRADVAARITEHLPVAQSESAANFDALASAVAGATAHDPAPHHRERPT